MHLSRNIKNFYAIIEKPGDKGAWLFDLCRPSSVLTDIDEDKICDLIKTSLVLLIDAKSSFERWRIPPSAKARVICLSTIKKLLRKRPEDLKVPHFLNAADALRWIDNTLDICVDKISARGIEDLVALECQVIPATVAMQSSGIPFDKSLWQDALFTIEEQSQGLKQQLDRYLSKCDGFLLFGHSSIDLNNPSSVKRALEHLLAKKLSGSSRKDLSDIDHQAVELLLKYREHCRLMSAYGNSLLDKADGGRLRGEFIPIGSASGRFACRSPNLLALPNDQRFQACLKPKAPNTILKLDYGAFELRILASLSSDRSMLDIFASDQDIHSRVAQAVFNQSVSKSENSHLRDRAKILNFGIIYGMGEKALAHELNTSIDSAQKLMKDYFAQFIGIKDYLISLEKAALKDGMVQTALGRRLYFLGDRDDRHIKRVARNMPIQGTGADIIKLALCKAYKTLSLNDLDAKIINVVHDEIVVECHRSQALLVGELIRSAMEDAFLSILPGPKPKVSIDQPFARDAAM